MFIIFTEATKRGNKHFQLIIKQFLPRVLSSLRSVFSIGHHRRSFVASFALCLFTCECFLRVFGQLFTKCSPDPHLKQFLFLLFHDPFPARVVTARTHPASRPWLISETSLLRLYGSPLSRLTSFCKPYTMFCNFVIICFIIYIPNCSSYTWSDDETTLFGGWGQGLCFSQL